MVVVRAIAVMILAVTVFAIAVAVAVARGECPYSATSPLLKKIITKK